MHISVRVARIPANHDPGTPEIFYVWIGDTLSVAYCEHADVDALIDLLAREIRSVSRP